MRCVSAGGPLVLAPRTGGGRGAGVLEEAIRAGGGRRARAPPLRRNSSLRGVGAPRCIASPRRGPWCWRRQRAVGVGPECSKRRFGRSVGVGPGPRRCVATHRSAGWVRYVDGDQLGGGRSEE